MKKLKERYDDHNMTCVPIMTLKEIAIIAEKGNRTIPKQVEKYLTESIAREKKKGRYR